MQPSFQNAFSLAGKTALITGGGSGLGLAMATCMAAAGARVVLAGRRADVLQNAAETIGPAACFVACDITAAGAADALVAETVKRHGRIDILVNNAGLQIKKPVEETAPEDLRASMEVHLVASFALTRAALPHLRAQGSGSVIFISSMTAHAGLDRVVSYSVAKSGVMGLVRSFASEASAKGIRFNAIAPGFMDSPMLRKSMDTDPARRARVEARTPMGRFGAAEDIGWAAVYLASDAARFVTGTELVVDGGFLTGF